MPRETLAGRDYHRVGMSVRRHRPTPRQEFVGRAALFTLGLLVLATGIGVGRVCLRLMFFVSDPAGRVGGRFMWLLVFVAAFLVLAGGFAVAFAFLPSVDKRPYGPPRGFEALSKTFDVFWAVVAFVFRRH
ncbi:MAG: hypothetical protein JWO31_2194 [Phycisphaerales bacterium]|nr:hypothetical protein [Phycisphaerales bacterium]